VVPWIGTAGAYRGWIHLSADPPESGPFVLYAIAYTVGMAGDGRDRVAGDLLRLARVKAGLTQAVLAERAGVAQTLISAYENGRRQPTLPTLMRLLDAAGFDLRMRLEAPDVQARAVEEWAASRPAGERRRWAREQAAVGSGR
jgi:transcriptional regulator with XRE-family HTH domain